MGAGSQTAAIMVLASSVCKQITAMFLSRVQSQQPARQQYPGRPLTCLAAFFLGFFWQQKQQQDSRDTSRQAAPATARKKYTPLIFWEPEHVQ